MSTTMQTQVRERPILFSGEMVRAILDGRKVQTRRVVKPQPDSVKPLGRFGAPVPYRLGGEVDDLPGVRLDEPIHCPHGRPGDRLWVREAFGYAPGTVPEEREVHHRAGLDPYPGGWPARRGPISDFIRWRPSIHMPRWASRITLEITEVRVERLQEMNLADAVAEGAWEWGIPGRPPVLLPAMRVADAPAALARWRNLWDGLNGPRGYGWDANPWVWVVSFRRVEGVAA